MLRCGITAYRLKTVKKTACDLPALTHPSTQQVLGNAPVRQEMQRMHQLVAAATGYAYLARVPAERPASDYTARLIPRHDDACVPLEAPQILWHR